MSSSPEHPPARTTPAASLARLLESTELAQAVPHLPAETLHRVIDHVGLEACRPLVAAATPAQLTAILDLDLWRVDRPGEDAQFDADRFGAWIESLVDDDAAQAAPIVARMPPAVVIAGLSRHLRVLDVSVFMPTAASDDEPPETGTFGDSPFELELEGYCIRARRHDAWEPIVLLLAELAQAEASAFHAIMRGCRRLSNAGRELDGLDDLAPDDVQWLNENLRARDARRQARGYVARSDARAFLALARHGHSAGARAIVAEAARIAGESAPVPAEPAVSAPVDPATPSAAGGAPASAARDVASAIHVVTTALAEAGLLPEMPRGLLAGEVDHRQPTRLLALMTPLQQATDAQLLLARGEELTFLSNSLMSGCALLGRPFTAAEASEAVTAACNLGLEYWPEPVHSDHLRRHDLLSAFEHGWQVLHHEVALFTAERLVAVIDGLPPRDAATLAGLRGLRQALVKNLRDGTPWLAGDALDILSTLDTPGWYGLLGLFSECPVLPAIATAIVERRAGRVSPSAFTFISERAHVEQVRRFVERLPDLFAG